MIETRRPSELGAWCSSTARTALKPALLKAIRVKTKTWNITSSQCIYQAYITLARFTFLSNKCS